MRERILKLYKYNIVFCKKVAGEIFLLLKQRKGAEGARYNLYRNFQAKGLLPDRTLESFIQKAPKGQFLIFGNHLTEFTKKSFPKHIGRIFQVKGQSKRVIQLFSYSVLFIYLKNEGR